GKFDVVIDEVNSRPFMCQRFVDDVPVVALIHQVAREVWFREVTWPAAVVGRYVLEPYWLSLYRDLPVLTVSEDSRESLVGYGLRNVSVVPEGLTLPAPARLGKEAGPTILFVGRL